MAEKKEKEENLPELIEIGKRLRELRIKAGYSNYEHFAWDNELNRQQYHNMETGKNFTLKSLLKVLAVHHLSLRQFFNEE